MAKMTKRNISERCQNIATAAPIIKLLNEIKDAELFDCAAKLFEELNKDQSYDDKMLTIFTLEDILFPPGEST